MRKKARRINMLLFQVYRSASTKVVGLLQGTLSYTKDKYEDVAGDDPAEILNGITLELEPYVFGDAVMTEEKLRELIDAYGAFQEAFDVDMDEELSALETILMYMDV